MVHQQRKLIQVSLIKKKSDEKIIFINNNILLFSNKKKIPKKYELYNLSQLKNQYTKNSIQFVKKKLSIYRSQLSKTLNYLHRTNHSDHYWGHIIDTWLIHIISSVKYRIDILKKIKKKYKKIYINDQNINLNVNSSWSIVNYLETSSQLNQFLYKRFSKLLNINVSKNYSANFTINDYEKKKFKNIFYYNFYKILIVIFKPIVAVDLLLKKNYLFINIHKILFVKSINFFLGHYSFSKKNHKMRDKFIVKEEDIYDKGFNAIVKDFIPMNFLENYCLIKNQLIFYIKFIKKILTSVAMHTDDKFKILIAEMSEIKKKKIFFQHGHETKLSNYFLMGYVEKKYADKYISWNNKRSFSNSFFLKNRSIKYNQNSNISFYLTVDRLYFSRYRMGASDSKFLNIIDFYKSLSNEFKKFFYVKKYPSNIKEIDKIIEAKLKLLVDRNIKIYSNFENTSDILLKTKIFISNYVSTSTFEYLSNNVPTIIIVDYKKLGYLNTVNSVFKLLQKNLIIQDSYIGAAKFINNNYSDIGEWWNSNSVQNAINIFKNNLCRNKDFSNKEFFDEINN
jgi:putative transferase (TIGR04331 family)